MNNINIINSLIELLGDEYHVINTWNNSDQISLDGVLAVTIDKVQILHHGTTRDNKTTVLVKGQTLTAEDVNQERINEMFDYAMNKLIVADIVDAVENCAGCLINGGNIECDGQQNTFNIQLELFICED